MFTYANASLCAIKILVNDDVNMIDFYYKETESYHTSQYTHKTSHIGSICFGMEGVLF